MRRCYDALIVGAGHGGAQAAIALRQRGFHGTVAIVGEEHDLPYERPPLSKDYLTGTRPFSRMLIRPASFWADRGIDLLLGKRVVKVEPGDRTISTDSGDSIGFGRLVWATGGSPRKLTCSGHDLVGVHVVRTRADVDRLTTELKGVERVAIVGGGYVGLEAAASLVKLGKRVTVVEAQDRILARVAGKPLSSFFEEEHRSRGVEIRLGATVASIEEREARVAGVRLEAGGTIPAEIVIVGIGIVPAVGPLSAAGAKGENGVAVDAHGRTSLPDVYAVGDCAIHANAFADGLPIRLESVQNAYDLATTVARHMTGDPEPYVSVPWFWSDQYDLKLQTIGLSAGHDQAVTRGNPASRSFSVVYLREGRVIALDCVNAVRDYVQGKSLVLGRAALRPEALADAGTPLKEIVAEAS